MQINDFVIRFANVNGTGSASANTMFAKTVFRMGVPVSPKNIFPSNIQGLPTWYEVRVSEKGYKGRRDRIDIAVGVNIQSLARDIQSVRPGGYFIYDNSRPLYKEFLREDIHFIGIPMMQMCLEHFQQPRQRLLLKNMVYIGALAALLDMDMEALRGIVRDQFEGKEKVIALNYTALDLGAEYARKHYQCPLDIRVSARDLNGDQIMIDGNTACGLGAIWAGATVAAWYPITPSTSLVNAFEHYANELRTDPTTGEKRFAVVQAEDELAAIGVVIGAAWNGARAFTATSGPGISLMNEFLGLAYFAEIPAVLVDVQRGGPSTGMPTRTQQSDLLLAAYASHGDTKHPLLFPADPEECFRMMADAFDLAERLQTPILVMTDLDIGMNEHQCAPLRFDPNRPYDRGKVLSAADIEQMAQFGRYLDVDGDGICYRTLPGVHPEKGAFFTRGTSRDEYARYTEDGAAYVRNMDRLTHKWETTRALVPAPELSLAGDRPSEIGLICCGSSIHAVLEACDLLAKEGLQADTLRLRAFPFSETVERFIQERRHVFVIDQNRDGQLRMLLINELQTNPAHLRSIRNYDGMPLTADFVARAVSQTLSQHAFAAANGS
ncbi:MAG: 2-oxoacid:acceptor oxidoreductase subunit alpha [Saprospiraceae bacterium]